MLVLSSFIIFVVFNSNEAARILAVIPTPSISHQVVFRPLTQELVKRGHEVVVITPDPAFQKGRTPANLTEIDVHDQSYKFWHGGKIKDFSKGKLDFKTQMAHVLNLFTKVQESYFKNEEIMNLVRDKNLKFDLILIEAMPRPALVFSYSYKAPVIQVSSFGGFYDEYNVIGAPTHPLLYPAITRRRIHNLSVFEKISEVYQQWTFDRLVMKHEEIDNAMLKKYLGKDVPTIKELANNVDMLFLNIHPMFEGIRPVPPGVLYMRGIHLKPEKDLPVASRDGSRFLLDMTVMKHEELDNAILKKYLGNDAPTVKELANNVHMLFLNIHPMFEGIRPVPPGVVYMGGIHQKPLKDLPEDLKTYLDSSKNGVIYLSFGTNVVPSLLPPERIQTILRVFSELPYNVLWKYDKDDLPGKTDNIKIGKWFPQSDVLRHPNIKLFITQGGLQSTDEAITAGVPLIGVPVLGDQWFNAEKYEYYKIGIKLDMETLNYDDLKTAINTILGDDSYRRNIVRLRELMQDEPMKPLERAMWWIEYVLRHGGAKHLRAPAANITWAEYLELDIVCYCPDF